MPGILSTIFNRKVGLVLGSGGAKGISHISVIEYLNELEIPIDMIFGSSIGALVGALFSAGTMDKFKKDLLALPVSKYSEFFEPILPVSGLLNDSKIMKFISNYIPESMKLEDMKIPVWIVATDYYTGMPLVFNQGNALEAVRASISIPGIFKPVRYEDSILVDGGVADPLPIDIADEMGAGLTIAVNLHPMVKIRSKEKIAEQKAKREEVKKSRIDLFIEKAKTISTMKKNEWLNMFVGVVMNRIKGEEKLPYIFDIISQSIDIMGFTNTKQMLEYNPPTVLIEPNLVHFNSLDFNRVEEALAEGKRACEIERDNLIHKVRALTKHPS